MAKDTTQIKVLTETHTLSVDGSDVGYLKGETVIEKTVDTNPIEVDQVRAALEYYPMATTMTVTAMLAQAALSNLKIVWNEAPAIASDTLKGGVVNVLPIRELVFTGVYRVGGATKTRTLTVFKCQTFASSANSQNVGNIAVVPVTFTVLPDLTKAKNEEFYTLADT